jgi:hypothetical protein
MSSRSDFEKFREVLTREQAEELCLENRLRCGRKWQLRRGDAKLLEVLKAAAENRQLKM